eukprot:TRINITY_DN12646_c0_g1_i3.p1 TRINITY_DN12646_c0_g1~~TRINITY_DN12646_c0_g1_i3.p1  ORF type:complete len:331 (+),score=61.02 TRINITY_DN12646_c0_g1_i3:159-1151(+)
MSKIASKDCGDIDTQPLMSKFALEVLGESIFHHNFGSLDGTGDEHYKAYEALLQIPRKLLWRFFPSLMDVLPISSSINFTNSRRLLKNLFDKMLNTRKANRNQHTTVDVLDYILDAASDGRLNEEEVYSNFWIFFIAGHDTTASALAWAIQCLIRYPEEQEKLYEEILSVIGKDRAIEHEDLGNLKYMSLFINEVLRMHPPVGFLPTRKTTQEIKIGDLTLPAGVTVGMNIYALHHNPKYWDDPEKFDPTRFSPQKMKGQHKFAFLPFSLGKRECIGNHFSLQEQHLFLASLLQKFRVLKPRNHPMVVYQSSSHIFNTPEHGYVNLVPRE